jgi:L-threonylcarbamoyladenylate synthase
MSSDNRHKPLDENEQYRRALEVLRGGGVVAMPTDTVFGLIAVAADAGAVARIYEIKRRDPAEPLPLFVADDSQAELIADVSDAARALTRRFWPGALTIVVPLRPSFRTPAAAGGDTVGVRAPGDPVLREIAAQLGPLTGTSANLAGAPEAHSAAEARAQLGDAVDMVVDARVEASGVPSTVVDCSQPGVVGIVREGGVSRDELAAALAGLADVG